jgi:hypothetical protein
MSKLTPQQAREKQARRLKASTEDIRLGIQRVNTAPGEQAAAKQEKMREKLVAAIDSGKWASRVKSVTLEEWKTKTASKGIPRIAAGIDEAAPKVEAFFAELFPFQDRLSNELNRMPDLTLEDSISRMTTWVRGMSQFKRGGR